MFVDITITIYILKDFNTFTVVAFDSLKFVLVRLHSYIVSGQSTAWLICLLLC